MRGGGGQSDRLTDRETYTETEKERQRQTGTERQTGTDRQRQTDRWTEVEQRKPQWVVSASRQETPQKDGEAGTGDGTMEGRVACLL